MSSARQKYQGVRNQGQSPQFKRTILNASILALLGTASLLPSGPLIAAEDANLADLKQENARLRRELEALRNARPVPAAAVAESEAATAATPVVSGSGSSSTELERVVVSGKKTLLRVKDVAQSISVVAGEDLKREDAVTLEAITKRMANVKWNYGNSSTSNYSIRGLGKISNVDNGDPSVGLYVDGVAYAYNQMAYFNFYDVDTVEVSRGPQGTQYGKNSTIGAIRVNYKRPSFTPGTEVTLGVSKYEDQKYQKSNGSLKASSVSTGPLVDGLLAYRTSLNVDKGSGWIENSYNADNRYISSDRVSGRIQLLLTPTPDFDARLSVEVNPRNSENVNIGSTNFFFTQTPGRYANGAVNSALTTEQRLARPWFTRNQDYTVRGNYFNQEFIASDTQQGVVTGSNAANLELNWNIADQFQLSSITAFRDYYFNAFRDDEGTVFDVQTAAGQNKVYSQYSQEFRLASRIDNVVDYQTGIFLQQAKSNSQGNAIYGTDGGAWFASNAQYGRLDVAGINGVSGRALLNDSLADLWKKTPSTSVNNSKALYANADWHISEPLIVNTGVRFTNEERSLSSSAYIAQNGYGGDLNPANLGGFNSNATGVLGANTAAQLAVADRVAQRYFGAANYAALTAAQQRQVADAKAIRNGRIGTLFNTFNAETYTGNHVTYSVAPRFKFNDNLTAYVSFAHGEKSGLPGVLSGTGTPVSYEVKPEKNDAFEIGAKSSLLDGSLVFNTAVYVNNIKDYQQNVFFVDEAATALARATDPNATTVYTSGAGNVPKVKAQGVEVDGIYSGIRNTVIRFAGAYNDARYKEFTLSANPVERANEGAFRDVSGYTLPGASKWSFNLGANYTLPIANNKLFKAGFNTTYVSRYNSDNALSDYAWIKGYSTTDISLGFAEGKGAWDVNFFVKNLFDDDTVRNQTWNAWAPGFQRQYGLVFSGKL
ncbi:MAG TPA: TonB-dependent receptor [Azonexus sp.]|nr:TonB-dependent receptor [Azonexus sp.]